jgi:glycosyltransferase involved in cell wall biosynthesis
MDWQNSRGFGVHNKTRRSGIDIMVLGLRGVPNVPGGVEVHASELYPRLAARGAKITVIGRSPYRPPGAPDRWRGIDVRWLWSPRMQGVEALVHTFLGVLYASIKRPDVLHIHAVGPWLMAPLAKMLGLNVVITHHGQDYLREKWKGPARTLLRLGEALGMHFADERIVISRGLLELARTTYERDATLIPNGVSEPAPLAGQSLLEKYGLTAQRYIVQVSRLVPEKRQLDLIEAFDAARLPGWKLLLVGGAQGSQAYADQVRRHCTPNSGIINTGFLSSLEVQELLTHAGVFVLPSSHEGLPISLLEAMKIGTPVLASDIPANLEVGLDPSCYFRVGDTHALASLLRDVAQLSAERREAVGQKLRAACAPYNWDSIADATLKVLERVAAKTVREERRTAPRLGAGYRR